MPSGSLQPSVEDVPDDDLGVTSDGVQHLPLRRAATSHAAVSVRQSRSSKPFPAPSNRRDRSVDRRSDSGYSSYAASSRSDRSSGQSDTVERSSTISQANPRRVSFVQPIIIENQRQTVQPRVEVYQHNPWDTHDLGMPSVGTRSRTLPPMVTQAVPSARGSAKSPFSRPQSLTRDEEIDSDSYSEDLDDWLDEPTSQRDTTLEGQSIVVPSRRNRRETDLDRPLPFVRSLYHAYSRRDPRQISYHGYISQGTVVQPARSGRRNTTVTSRRTPEQPKRWYPEYYGDPAHGYTGAHGSQFQNTVPPKGRDYRPEISNSIDYGRKMMPPVPPNNSPQDGSPILSYHSEQSTDPSKKLMISLSDWYNNSNRGLVPPSNSPQNDSPILSYHSEQSTGASKKPMIGLSDWHNNSNRGYGDEHHNLSQKTVKSESSVTSSVAEPSANSAFESQSLASKPRIELSHFSDRDRHVRFKVDSDAPLSQALTENLEGRRLQFLPADEGGINGPLIADSNGTRTSHRDEGLGQRSIKPNRRQKEYIETPSTQAGPRSILVESKSRRSRRLAFSSNSLPRRDIPRTITSIQSRTISDEDDGGLEATTDSANTVTKSLESRSEESSDPGGDIESFTKVSSEPHILIHAFERLKMNWKDVWNEIPDIWKWDLEHHTIHGTNGKGNGCWTCTPLESDEPKLYPLTIASVPVVLPVEYQWPPVGGLNPPPDPRPSTPIDCRTELPLDVVRDLFLTFVESIGFYILISGLIQVIVPSDFDTKWASSHLPHKYGGLKVCYIQQNLEPTTWPSTTEMAKPAASSRSPPGPSMTSLVQRPQAPIAHLKSPLNINGFIEARPSSAHNKEKFSGRIGLKVLKENEPYLIMSTHIITEAIMARSNLRNMFGKSRHRIEKLNGDWNEHVDIWAGNEKVGRIDRSFDNEAEIYPNGFHHDITLIKPDGLSAVRDIASPVKDMGWLDHESWVSLRQQSSAVKILGPTEDHRAAKSIRCSRPSEILVVGEGIFRNQTAAAGSKPLKDHDMSTWKDLVSRALLYRVHPDFDPPNGYSGVALYADGIRQDGTEGPGIVGFQSFVQRSGHVQNFDMEGSPLDKRLQLGRIAFYGAFEVPGELKREYTIA